MEYKPVRPQQNDNVTDVHPLKDFTILLMGFIALIVAAFLILGFFVDVMVARIPPEKETAWFSDSAFSTRVTESLAGNAQLQALLFPGFHELQKCAGVDVPIKVYFSESDTVNAVAIPGGNIVVFQGLLDNVSSENGLAFVLAHELGHFKHRDHLKSMGRGLVLLGITGIISGGNSSLMTVVGSLTGFEQARFSQARESAADQFALAVINCRYGHVGGADEFFKSMLKADDSLLKKLNHYFASHPEVNNRIAQLKHLSAKNQYQEKSTRPLKLELSKPSKTEDL